jgi:predicted Zn-dependent protease
VNEAQQRVARLGGYFAADPTNLALACDLYDAHLAAGDPPGAGAFLATLSPELQTQPGIRFRSARSALMAGRYGDAAASLRSMIDEGVDEAALWHDLAFAQLCLKAPGDASETLAQARERHGDTAELAILATRIAMMAEDFPRANAEIERALALAPNHSTALGLRALVLLDSGDIAAAAQAAKTCLTQFPDQHEAMLVAGQVTLHATQFPQAEAIYARALERFPNSGRALAGYGQAMMARGELAGGRAQLEHAVRSMPDHIGTWHALAWAQLLTGDVAAAEHSYRKAYDIDRNFGDTHGGLALIDALHGRTAEAEAGIKRALRLAPNSATAMYAQAVLLEDRGQGAAAESQMADLLSRIPLPTGVTPGEFARQLRSRLQPNAR